MEEINHNTKKFRFALPNKDDVSGLQIASAVLTKYKGAEMEKPVIRPYTPTSDEDAKGHIDFVIKKYPNGPMSEHLHEMKPEQRLDFKGPIPKYSWEPNKHDHIALIAGGTGITPYVRVSEPPSVCLGPDDPRVDPTVAIPAIIDRDFQRVVVLKGIARVTPAPDTLVNVETRFATDAPASYEIPLTVLGQSVVITASAASWTWHFGDGTMQRLTDGDSGGSTVHEYRRSGPRAAWVVIEWTGTYVIGCDPTVRQVNGSATTVGEPAQIAVRTARSELVDQPG